MVSAWKGDADGVKLLLDHGANTDKLKGNEYNPVCAAVDGSIGQKDASGHIQVLKTFHEKLDKHVMYQLYSTNVPLIKLSPLQLATVNCTAEMLGTILKDTRTGEFNDEKQSAKIKYCFIRGIIPVSLVEPGAKDDGLSCLELIARSRTRDDIVKVCRMKPLKMCISSIATARTWTFSVLFFLHVAFMCCFSIFVAPTCLHTGTNATASWSNGTSTGSVSLAFAAFVV